MAKFSKLWGHVISVVDGSLHLTFIIACPASHNCQSVTKTPMDLETGFFLKYLVEPQHSKVLCNLHEISIPKASRKSEGEGRLHLGSFFSSACVCVYVHVCACASVCVYIMLGSIKRKK